MHEALSAFMLVVGAVAVLVAASVGLDGGELWDVPVPVAVAGAVSVVLPPGVGDVAGVKPPSEPGDVAAAPPQADVTRIQAITNSRTVRINGGVASAESGPDRKFFGGWRSVRVPSCAK